MEGKWENAWRDLCAGLNARMSARLRGRPRWLTHTTRLGLRQLLARISSPPSLTPTIPLRLLLTLLVPVATTIVMLNLAPALMPAHAAEACQWYTVRPGDTLGKLAAANGTDITTLVRLNHIADPNLILVGQRLCLPPAPATDGNGSSSGGQTVDSTQPVNLGPVSGAQDFVAFALPYAEQAHAATSWPVSLILAQWGLEQGWKAPGYTGFNWGNVAALPGEPTVNGVQKWGSPPAFAFAKTPQDGLRYYLHVAGLAYYQAVAPAALSGGADAAARALGRSPWDAGHYTNHRDPGSSLIALMQANNLYTYDGH
jgi:hypothetical protein